MLQSMGRRVEHDRVTEQDYKTLRIRHLVNLYDLEFGNEFLDMIYDTQNRNNKRKKIERLNFIKMCTFVYQRTLPRKGTGTPQNEGKALQITQLISI